MAVIGVTDNGRKILNRNVIERLFNGLNRTNRENEIKRQ